MEQQVTQNTQETQTTSTTAAAAVEKPKSKTGTAIKIVAGAGIAAYAFKKYVWDAGLLDDILGKSTEEEVVDTAVNTFIGLFK